MSRDRNRQARETEGMNFAELARLEDELQKARRESGIEETPPLWKRLGDKYFDWQENREKHLVNKKVYLILTALLGWLGIHRFYERRWKLGLFYLALSWTGYPACLVMVDFLIALPVKADSSGCILI